MRQCIKQIDLALLLFVKQHVVLSTFTINNYMQPGTEFKYALIVNASSEYFLDET